MADPRTLEALVARRSKLLTDLSETNRLIAAELGMTANPLPYKAADLAHDLVGNSAKARARKAAGVGATEKVRKLLSDGRVHTSADIAKAIGIKSLSEAGRVARKMEREVKSLGDGRFQAIKPRG